MTKNKCCSALPGDQDKVEYETARIEQISATCPMCEDYSRVHEQKTVAVMCCEGACLRGEIARQAANIICHRLAPGKTVRICLGGAFTKNTGQRNLVRKAVELIALEGCFLQCSARMMKGVLPGLAPKVIIADSLYDFDRNLFAINEMAEDEIRNHALTVAEKVVSELK